MKAREWATGPGPGGRRGFVMAFVVFMLFAVAIAGATGYLVVTSEFELSKHSGEGAEALTVARAGLERFVAVQIGGVQGSASYALGDGVAAVTSRKLLTQDSDTDVYYIRSEATVADVRTPDTPARRVVAGYALLHKSPLSIHAAVMIGADRIDVNGDGRINGADAASGSGCTSFGGSTITGAVARLNVTEEYSYDVQGNPAYELWSGGWSAIADSIALRWDVLTDPDFPFEFDNTFPNFSTIPADSFPIIRYTGWLMADFTGRGALIVDGTFDPGPDFNWHGIVVAKDIDDIVQGDIDGLLVAGVEAPNVYSVVDFRTNVRFQSCYVAAANESLSYLELIPATVHETN